MSHPITLKQTKDYSRFHPNETNRLIIQQGHVQTRKDLVQSMREHGFFSSCPLITVKVNGHLIIHDGHNRLSAAMSLAIPVFYLVYTEEQIGDMNPIAFSRTQKKWTLQQYAEAYEKKGQEDYEEVMRFHRQTKIGVSMCFAMFRGHTINTNTHNTTISDGTYKIKDRITPHVVADIVKCLSQYFKPAYQKCYVAAINKAIHAEGFEVDRFKDKIRKYPDMLSPCSREETTIEMLQKLYNYKAHGKPYRLAEEIYDVMRRREFGRDKTNV